jgi:PAS domain S-box-containing protein
MFMGVLRNSGIERIGDTPWGTHFCLFYETKEDLTDILVPYFKAGLQNNEYCMWVTSDPLGVEEAIESLQKAVPDIDAYLDKKQLEIIPYTEWYVKDGGFISKRVLNGWVEKLNKALDQGYEGLRVTGNTFWLKKENWDAFVDYEEELDKILDNFQIIAMCTYSLDKCDANQIIDVVKNHQFTLIKRDGHWTLVESTKQKKTKEALEKVKIREKFFANAIEFSTQPFSVEHHDGRLVMVNQAFEDLTGYTGEELDKVDRSKTLTPEEFRKKEQLKREELHSSGNPVRYEKEYLRKDGTRVPVERLVHLIKNEDGTPQYYYSFITDISKRKKAQKQNQKLLENEHQLASELKASNRALQLQKEYLVKFNLKLQESEDMLNRSQRIAKLGSWELDLKNNQLFWSDEVYRIFGLQPQEFTATYEAFLDRVHPDDRKAVDDAYTGSLQEDKDGYEIVYRVVKKSTGEIRTVQEKYTNFRDESGQITRSLGMVHDITERQKAEEHKQELLEMEKQLTEELSATNEELMATTEELKTANEELIIAQNHLTDMVEKLKTSNRELEQFAYVASHDLQEPLRMVGSFTQLLKRRYKGKLDEDADDYIDFIIDGAQRMKDLIDDLLAFSRLNTQTREFEPVIMDVALNDVLNNLKTSITYNKAQISHDNLPVINGDPSQINQLLQNLIANAIKFQGERPPNIHISAEELAEQWLFSVEDEGIGIDPQYQEQIFRIFKRLHTREEYEGTGIGLAICKRIVERHDGKIWVESELGKGSIFYFKLPKGIN